MFTRFFNAAQARVYLKQQAGFVLFAVLLSAVTWYGANAIPFEGMLGLVMKGCVAAIISGSISLAIFRSDIKVAIESFLNKNKETLFH